MIRFRRRDDDIDDEFWVQEPRRRNIFMIFADLILFLPRLILHSIIVVLIFLVRRFRILRWLADVVLWLPRRLSGGVTKFIGQWFATRRWRSVILGSPALILGVAFVLTVWGGQNVPDDEIVSKYRYAAILAYRSDQKRAADLWLRKVSHHEKLKSETQFNLAITAGQQGDTVRANQIMVSLAPDDSTGYEPAHLWRGKQMMSVYHPSNQPLADLIRHHLSIGLEAEPNDIVAREQIGKLEMSQGNIPAAIEHYRQLVLANAKFSHMLAKLQILNGDQDSARMAGEIGIKQYETELEGAPGNADARIQLAHLHGFFERYDEATTILRKGVKRVPAPSVQDMERLRTELGNLYLLWSDHLRKKRPEAIAERLNHLQNALTYLPDNTSVFELMASLTRGNSPDAKAAQVAMDQLIDVGKETPMVHLTLAIAAVERNEFEVERHHLEKALAGDPTLSVAANNLAWRLAVSEPPQLKRAFELVNQAIDQSPERLEFISTRGRIHAMQGRPDKAIADLEKALAGLESRPDISEALGDLYESKGYKDLARRHRDQAEKVRAAAAATATDQAEQ